MRGWDGGQLQRGGASGPLFTVLLFIPLLSHLSHLNTQTYEFQLVVKQPADARQAPEQLLERYRRIVADTTAANIPAEACTVKERLGGKFVSLCIPARVQAAHVVDLVWAALADDPALVMKY